MKLRSMILIGLFMSGFNIGAGTGGVRITQNGTAMIRVDWVGISTDSDLLYIDVDVYNQGGYAPAFKIEVSFFDASGEFIPIGENLMVVLYVRVALIPSNTSRTFTWQWGLNSNMGRALWDMTNETLGVVVFSVEVVPSTL